MPIILQLGYADGSSERMYIPAEIWRRNSKNVSKLIVSDKVLTNVTVDPQWETADVDISNNHYPRKIIQSRVEAYKSKKRTGLVYRDIMQDIKTELKTDEDDKEDKED